MVISGRKVKPLEEPAIKVMPSFCPAHHLTKVLWKPGKDADGGRGYREGKWEQGGICPSNSNSERHKHAAQI